MSETAADAVDGTGENSILLVGEELKRARESRSMAVKEVASRLNLEEKVVHDLEQNNYNALPEAAYVRGYLLAYIRLMELPVSLLESYDTAHIHTQPLPTGHSSMQNACSRDGWVRCVSGGLILMLVVVVALWVLEQQFDLLSANSIFTESVTEVEPVEMQEATVTSVVSMNNTLEQADVVKPKNINSIVTESADTESVVTDSTITNDRVSQPETDDITGQVEGSTETVDSQPTASANTLQMTFSGETWVRVDDAEGKKLRAGTFKRGESINIEHDGKLHLIIGRTGNVALIYAGKSVDLSSYKSGTIARLVLGDLAE